MIDKNRIQKLINQVMSEYPAAQPCWNDWQRSWTEFDGKVVVWFNVPLAGDDEGLTTKIIMEG
jgi:hypothetical protein